MSTFILDPRLAGESVHLAHLPLCEVRLRDDARLPWLILVPRRAGLVELHDLYAPALGELIAEAAAASAALCEVTQADKINTGALGNVVRQLHVHVVARRVDDFAWPGPVWGVGARQPMMAAERAGLATALAQALARRRPWAASGREPGAGAP